MQKGLLWIEKLPPSMLGEGSRYKKETISYTN